VGHPYVDGRCPSPRRVRSTPQCRLRTIRRPGAGPGLRLPPLARARTQGSAIPTRSSVEPQQHAGGNKDQAERARAICSCGRFSRQPLRAGLHPVAPAGLVTVIVRMASASHLGARGSDESDEGRGGLRPDFWCPGGGSSPPPTVRLVTDLEDRPRAAVLALLPVGSTRPDAGFATRCLDAALPGYLDPEGGSTAYSSPGTRRTNFNRQPNREDYCRGRRATANAGGGGWSGSPRATTADSLHRPQARGTGPASGSVTVARSTTSPRGKRLATSMQWGELHDGSGGSIVPPRRSSRSVLLPVALVRHVIDALVRPLPRASYSARLTSRSRPKTSPRCSWRTRLPLALDYLRSPSGAPLRRHLLAPRRRLAQVTLVSEPIERRRLSPRDPRPSRSGAEAVGLQPGFVTPEGSCWHAGWHTSYRLTACSSARCQPQLYTSVVRLHLYVRGPAPKTSRDSGHLRPDSVTAVPVAPVLTIMTNVLPLIAMTSNCGDGRQARFAERATRAKHARGSPPGASGKSRFEPTTSRNTRLAVGHVPPSAMLTCPQVVSSPSRAAARHVQRSPPYLDFAPRVVARLPSLLTRLRRRSKPAQPSISMTSSAAPPVRFPAPSSTWTDAGAQPTLHLWPRSARVVEVSWSAIGLVGSSADHSPTSAGADKSTRRRDEPRLRSPATVHKCSGGGGGRHRGTRLPTDDWRQGS